MNVKQIPFKKTGYFSKLMIDYLEKSPTINPFYNNFPNYEGFEKQIQEKKTIFSEISRKVLANALTEQYVNFSISEATKSNIKNLQQHNTFTITTGHQLNLFTGPLYFLYKIFSVINLCEDLAEKYPDYNFVPIYWMATEDHDFDEINFFNYKSKKIEWKRKDGGAVGGFSLEGLEEVYNNFSTKLGASKNADYLRALFSTAYLKHDNLADATRYIANTLFGKYGLVIMDGDNKALKSLYKPFIKQELEEQLSFKEVSETNQRLEENYGVQVNPREINLFYLTEKSRERIIFDGEKYLINNTNLFFTKDELLIEVENHPEKFSPNVILRPLYQEVILPNICYVGGGGELAYWLQLKSFFKKSNVPFPILLLRNSVQVVSEKQYKKLSKLDINLNEIFTKQHKLLSHKVKENSDLELSFVAKKEFLRKQFQDLKDIAVKTDVTFLNAVNAQEAKQIKGLEKLEKRLLKAEKRRLKDLVSRITELQNELLPNQSLEERQRNFSEYYEEYGDEFLVALKENLNPLQLEFSLLKMP